MFMPFWAAAAHLLASLAISFMAFMLGAWAMAPTGARKRTVRPGRLDVTIGSFSITHDGLHSGFPMLDGKELRGVQSVDVHLEVSGRPTVVIEFIPVPEEKPCP